MHGARRDDDMKQQSAYRLPFTMYHASRHQNGRPTHAHDITREDIIAARVVAASDAMVVD